MGQGTINVCVGGVLVKNGDCDEPGDNVCKYINGIKCKYGIINNTDCINGCGCGYGYVFNGCGCGYVFNGCGCGYVNGDIKRS